MKKYLHRRLLLEWRTDEQIERDTLVRKIRVQSFSMYTMGGVVLAGMLWVGVSILSSEPVSFTWYISPYVVVLACISFVATWMRRDLLIQNLVRYQHTPKYILADKAFPDLYNRKDSIPHSKYRYFIHRVDKMCKHV